MNSRKSSHKDYFSWVDIAEIERSISKHRRQKAFKKDVEKLFMFYLRTINYLVRTNQWPSSNASNIVEEFKTKWTIMFAKGFFSTRVAGEIETEIYNQIQEIFGKKFKIETSPENMPQDGNTKIKETKKKIKENVAAVNNILDELYTRASINIEESMIGKAYNTLTAAQKNCAQELQKHANITTDPYLQVINETVPKVKHECMNLKYKLIKKAEKRLNEQATSIDHLFYNHADPENLREIIKEYQIELIKLKKKEEAYQTFLRKCQQEILQKLTNSSGTLKSLLKDKRKLDLSEIEKQLDSADVSIKQLTLCLESIKNIKNIKRLQNSQEYTELYQDVIKLRAQIEQSNNALINLEHNLDQAIFDLEKNCKKELNQQTSDAGDATPSDHDNILSVGLGLDQQTKQLAQNQAIHDELISSYAKLKEEIVKEKERLQTLKEIANPYQVFITKLRSELLQLEQTQFKLRDQYSILQNLPKLDCQKYVEETFQIFPELSFQMNGAQPCALSEAISTKITHMDYLLTLVTYEIFRKKGTSVKIELLPEEKIAMLKEHCQHYQKKFSKKDPRRGEISTLSWGLNTEATTPIEFKNDLFHFNSSLEQSKKILLPPDNFLVKIFKIIKQFVKFILPVRGVHDFLDKDHGKNFVTIAQQILNTPEKQSENNVHHSEKLVETNQGDEPVDHQIIHVQNENTAENISKNPSTLFYASPKPEILNNDKNVSLQMKQKGPALQ